MEREHHRSIPLQALCKPNRTCPQRISMRSQLADFEEELQDYARLKSGDFEFG